MMVCEQKEFIGMAKLKLVKPYRLTLTSNHMLAENYSQKRQAVILKQ